MVPQHPTFFLLGMELSAASQHCARDFGDALRWLYVVVSTLFLIFDKYPTKTGTNAHSNTWFRTWGKGFDEGFVDWFARAREIERYTVMLSPQIHTLRDELVTITPLARHVAESREPTPLHQ